MNKLKVSALLIATVLTVNISRAQTIEDGRKSMYYEKYKTAAATFQSLITANPANTDAIYWLGQTYLRNLDNPNIAAAKDLYQKALMANSGSALLTAAMGHIAVAENNWQDARSRFETAISLSQGKSIPVLNAIGFAIVNSYSLNNNKSVGDPAYAVEKLQLATTIKGNKDPDVFINLGDAYRKLDNDGANPVKNYQAALQLDPNYAKAYMRIGRIYESQGPQQFDLFLENYNTAIQKDPAYGPGYYALYKAYYETEGHISISKAGEYLEKYLSNTEEPNSPINCFYRQNQLFSEKKFQESINKAKECISSGGNDTYPNVYGLMAYTYLRLNDSSNAKLAFDDYFKKAKPANITSADYNIYVLLLLRFPGNETLASSLIAKAIEMDTTEAGKIASIKTMAGYYERLKMFKDAGDWYKKILTVKKNPSQADIFNAGYSYYKAALYQDAIEQWTLYTTKFPNEVLGYDMKGRSERYIDSTLANGLANASFQKVVDLGEAQWATDSVKVKSQLLRAFKYFIEYSANVKNDRPAAVAWCDRYLTKDPNDIEVINFRKALSGPAPKTTKPATPAKPTGSTQPKATTTGATKPPVAVTKSAPKTTTVPVKKK